LKTALPRSANWRKADFLRLPFGIKGKKLQDKKTGAFRSGLRNQKTTNIEQGLKIPPRRTVAEAPDGG